MIFQKLIWASLAVALAVGTLQTGVQQLQATPIILAAETYEDQKADPPTLDASHADHAGNHKTKDWSPDDGLERMGWTFVANLLHAFSMTLLVFAVMGVSVFRGTKMGAMPLALVTAAAGWLVFYFWPSLGLHAEIPGMEAARLGSRQGWWLLAAVSAALACGALALVRGPLRWAAAAALLALPYAVGAPHIMADPLAGFNGEAQSVLRDLGSQLVWATTWISLSFWLCMGLASGLAFQHWLQSQLRSALNPTGSQSVTH